MDILEDIIIHPGDEENPEYFGSQPAAKINPHLSDLFFNYDVSDAINEAQGGVWDGYSLPKFRDVADTFLMTLTGLGLQAVDSLGPDDLIRDFLKRV